MTKKFWRNPFRRASESLAAAGPVDPTSAAEIPPYIEAFAACASYSASVHAGTGNMSVVPTDEAPQRLADALGAVVMSNKITEDDFRSSAGQCLKWAHYLAPSVERATKIPCWPTLGQLWKGDKKIWGPTWSELDTLVKKGVHAEDIAASGGQGVNLHAWLTLSTGEIIDFTFASTLAVVQGGNYADLLCTVVYGPEEQVLKGHRYYPMLAGVAAIEDMQSKSTMPLLARSREELGAYSFALVPTWR